MDIFFLINYIRFVNKGIFLLILREKFIAQKDAAYQVS